MYEQFKDKNGNNVIKILTDHQPPSRRVENYPFLGKENGEIVNVRVSFPTQISESYDTGCDIISVMLFDSY